MHRFSALAVRGIARNDASVLRLNGWSEQQCTPPVATIATVLSASGHCNGVQGISLDNFTFMRNCKTPGTLPIQRAMLSPCFVSFTNWASHSRKRLVGV